MTNDEFRKRRYIKPHLRKVGNIENQFSVLLAQKIVAEKRKITIVGVARATGISWSILAKWAKNKDYPIDAETIDALCKYFNCEPGDLIRLLPDSIEK